MTADIYIPTANNMQALTACLDSLSRQTFKNFSILLIGLKKDQMVTKLLQKYPQLIIKYHIQSAPGLVQAARDATDLSTADIFIRIDDDVVVEANWLESIVKIFQQDTAIGGVTGPTLTTDAGRNARDLFLFFEKAKTSKNPIMRFALWIYTAYIYENSFQKIGEFLRSGAFTLGSNFPECLSLKTPIEVDNLEACNMAIRRSVLVKVGGFDLTFNRGLGDYHEADMAYKIKDAGYRVVFAPGVRLQHKVETTATTSKARPDAFHRISNFIIFYKRHIGIRNLDYFARFMTNVLFQNAYYGYKFLTTGDSSQLGAIPGTMYGLLQ